MIDKNGHTWSYEYDEIGNVIKSKDPLGNTYQYSYDNNGNLRTDISPMGFVMAATYDAMGRQISEEDVLGFHTYYEYDLLGRLIALHQKDGTTLYLKYDANGNLLKSVNADGKVVIYTYDLNGNRLSSTNEMGGVTSYTYDKLGNMLTMTTPLGFTVTYTYDGKGNLLNVTMPNGAVTSYTYNKQNQFTSTTDPNGGTKLFTFDERGNISTMTDPEGNVSKLGYDSINRLTSMTDGRGNTWTYKYDAEGNLTVASDPLQNSSSKSYDGAGQLVTETDANGNTWHYTYDADGRITSKTDPLSNTITYTYDAAGQLLSEETALGLVTSYEYDAMGRKTKEIDPGAHAITFYYDSLGRLVGLTNKDDTTVSYIFDDCGNHLTTTDEEGYFVSYLYDADGRMIELTNARGYKTQYEYDSVGNLIKTTDALNGEESKVYDLRGNLLSVTNRDDNTTTYTYDRNGRVLTITDPRGSITATEYDANGNITKITQADKNTIIYTYDAANRLTTIVDAAGYTHSYSYDGNGNVIIETDGNGNITYYEYDGLDHVVGKTDGDGGVCSKTYDADGRLVKVINEVGAETSYIYDSCGRVIEMVDALGNSTVYTYDEMDRLLTITNPRKGVTRYTYTDRGDVKTVTDAEGYTISYEYDGNHNMVKMTTVDGDTIYEYDPLDRLISTTTPDGQKESYEYNGEGEITGHTDKGGHKTKYILDANGNIIETIDALGNSAVFEYDSMNNLVATKLHRVDTQDNVDEWEITTYAYEGRGLVTQTVDALGNVTVYEYDGNANLAKTIDPDGFITENTYNALNLVISINYSGGKNVSYWYNGVGDLVKMEDWTGTNTYEYDLLSQLKKVSDHKGNVVEYSYDSTGNQTQVIYPDSTVVTKTYDLVSNLTSVVESDGRTTNYQYDGMARLVHMEYPDGWKEDYTYDSIGQLLSIYDTDPSEKDMKQQKNKYVYDVCGNMTYEYMRGNGTGEATTEVFYTYDELHRLVKASENYGNASRNYQYDSLGNLTYEWNSNNEKWDYKLNNLNQITTKSDVNSKDVYTFSYDGRGNLIRVVYTKNKKSSDYGTYIYDETNTMVSGTNISGEVSTYIYNGLGALVRNEWIIEKNAYGYHSMTAPGETLLYSSTLKNPSVVIKEYVVDYTSTTFEPMTEHEINGVDYKYVYGNDRLSVNITGVTNGAGHILENGEIRLYYHMDIRGTADYLTSPVSKKVESWTHYNEWGVITHNTVIKCGEREFDMVKRYATHDYDQVLDLYYAKARFYSATDRRFVAIDPILNAGKYDISSYLKDPMLLIQYLYVKDNPLTNIDPLGLFSEGDKLSRSEIISQRNTSKSDIQTLRKALNEYQNALYLPVASDGKSDFGNALDIRNTPRLDETSTVYDTLVENAVNKFKDHNLPGGNSGQYRGVVGITTWQALGLGYYKKTSTGGYQWVSATAKKPPITETLPIPEFDFTSITGITEAAEWLLKCLESAPQTLFAWDPAQGIWYATVEAPQRAFGYNDLYNSVFALAGYVPNSNVSYKSFIAFFSEGAYSYRIEGWKGNYMQMGVGSEIGIYAENTADREQRIKDSFFYKLLCASNVRHYPVAPKYMWPKIDLKISVWARSGERTILARPAQYHWWIDGFNPSEGTIHPDNLIVRSTMTFQVDGSSVASKFIKNVKEGAYGLGNGGDKPGTFNFTTERSGATVSIYWK